MTFLTTPELQRLASVQETFLWSVDYAGIAGTASLPLDTRSASVSDTHSDHKLVAVAVEHMVRVECMVCPPPVPVSLEDVGHESDYWSAGLLV